MKRLFKMATALAAFAMVGGLAHGQLPNQNWTGSGDQTTFLDAANWDTGTVPGIIDPAAVPIEFTNNFIIGNFTVDRSVDSNVNFTAVDGGAVLNITGGTHSDSISNVNRRTSVGGAGGAGTVNQSGGSWTIGHALRIGIGGGTANGVYNLTGGTLIVSRSSNSAITPAPDGGRPTVELGGIDEGSSGLLEISGDAIFQTRTAIHVLNTGTFSVIGSTATEIGIGSALSADGRWLQLAGGTLRVGLDSGGLTPILVDVVDGSAGAGDAIFEAGSILDPYDAGSANNAWTTVMTWEGTLDNGGSNNNLVLSTDATTAGWEMQIVGNELQVRNPNFPDPPVGELGDFDLDGDVDLADLDQYNGNIGAAAVGGLEALDLDGNGTVDAGDFQRHYTELVETSNGQKGTFAGDVNLDGTVNVLGDAFPLVGNLNTAATSWSQGDLNGDGTVNVLGDAFVLIGNLGNTNNP